MPSQLTPGGANKYSFEKVRKHNIEQLQTFGLVTDVNARGYEGALKEKTR